MWSARRMLALEHGDPLMEELTRIIALQRQFAEAGDIAKFMAADDEFHQKLYAGAGKSELWTLVKNRSGHIDRLRRLHLPSPGKAQDIVRHHQLIATAIAANQPDEAQRHLRDHLSGTLGYLAEIRVRFPEYLSE
jgi:DNA-binding GntR family transcriptional regulator